MKSAFTDVVICFLAAAVLLIIKRFIYGFSERTLRDVIPFLRRIILEDLQNLLHPEVEDHIRATSSRKHFKRMQWKRIKLALQYLGDLGENAAIVHAWAQYERKLSIQFPDPERKRASIELITACIQSRFSATRMRFTLHCWLIRMAFLPFLPPPSFRELEQRGSFDIFALYEQMKKAAGELSLAYGQSFYDELFEVL
ncbi:MAG TPA: hypothetical protein VFR24_04810 [Candidatus Angelobacter sp.]|nr:hypothetical protein [Candidatus Angelobacter sp.]